MFDAHSHHIVTDLRRNAVCIALIAGILTMTSGILFASPTHEVCDAMRHGCDKAEMTCCCGDRSETTPSPAPACVQTVTVSPTVAIAAIVPVAAALNVALVPITFSPHLRI